MKPRPHYVATDMLICVENVESHSSSSSDSEEITYCQNREVCISK